MKILNFLGYIFQEFIRDENSILVQPIEYQIAAQKMSLQYSNEFKFYKRFQFFVKNVFTDNIETQTPEVFFLSVSIKQQSKNF